MKKLTHACLNPSELNVFLMLAIARNKQYIVCCTHERQHYNNSGKSKIYYTPS